MMRDAPYDFDDQEIRIFDAISMAQGDQIRVTCTYQNTTEDVVKWGDSTNDEMCFAGVIRYPALDEGFLCAD